MNITSIEDVSRVVAIDPANVFVVNGDFAITPPNEIFTILNEWVKNEGLEDYPTDVTEAEMAIAQPLIDKQIAYNILASWKRAGQFILDEVSILLAQKAPTPSEGLANLAALETVDKLLSRGDLRVAKAALEAADLTGTSFDGDSDSYDYIIGLLDQKIAELTP